MTKSATKCPFLNEVSGAIKELKQDDVMEVMQDNTTIPNGKLINQNYLLLFFYLKIAYSKYLKNFTFLYYNSLCAQKELNTFFT